MAKRFEYNFTRENQFEQLKQKNHDLMVQNRRINDENTKLKESLEELMKVNEELTESLEELNSDHQMKVDTSANDELQHKMSVMHNENIYLRNQLQQAHHSAKKNNNSSHIESEETTEKLVVVIEQLINEFKQVQQKHEDEIAEMKKQIEECRENFQYYFSKLQEDYQRKVNIFEQFCSESKMKEECFKALEDKVRTYEQSQASTSLQQANNNNVNNNNNLEDRKYLDDQIKEKNKIINIYSSLIKDLKVKINAKV